MYIDSEMHQVKLKLVHVSVHYVSLEDLTLIVIDMWLSKKVDSLAEKQNRQVFIYLLSVKLFSLKIVMG